MPFTISHIAAVLPLKRNKFFKDQVDSMVIGSMIPDLVYALPFRVNRSFSHSIRGFFLFSIPIGLISLILFRKIFREPLVTLLPVPVQMRLDKPRFFMGWNSVAALIAAIAGHLLWDAFTHGNFPFASIFPYSYNFYFQFYSSVCGLTVLLLSLLIWLKKAPVCNRSSHSQKGMLSGIRKYIVLIPFVFSVFMGLITMVEDSKRYIAYHFSGWFMFGGGSLFAFLFLLYTVLYYRNRSVCRRQLPV